MLIHFGNRGNHAMHSISTGRREETQKKADSSGDGAGDTRRVVSVGNHSSIAALRKQQHPHIFRILMPGINPLVATPHAS